MRYALLGILGGFVLAYATPAAAPVSSYPPLEPASSTSLSYNWAGYVAQGARYSGVSGRWVVPQVSGGGALAADATWVGLGGVASNDLIQAGTQAIVQDSRVSYQAWLELMPAPSKPVPLDISPGDEVSVAITQAGEGLWNVVIRNESTGDSFKTKVAYDSSGSSAEWIEEMPAALSGTFIPLSDFGSVRFLSAAAQVGTTTVGIEQAGGSALGMINRHGEVLATPSVLTAQSGFSVVRSSAAPTLRGSASRYAPRRGIYR